ncbi:MAG: alkaline phosphatase family protein [Clostridia bacterium]|nr:alkaline phosphatase family protein [Clostridia bacterium]
MDKKVILISIDGMRPDGLAQCGNPYVEELKKIGSYAMDARTVFPSVTLPCHMSMFHSVNPDRHGTTTNTYMPPVRPFNGLFEQIKNAGGESAIFYGWEQIRDVARPGSLNHAVYIGAYTYDHTDGLLTDAALRYIQDKEPDFVFLYMVETDDKGGHDSGWMTETYLEYLSTAINNAKRVIEACGDRYTVIITADHGGHDRTHGTMMDEDMTIPMMFVGEPFEPGRALENVSMLDLTPTIAKILNVPAVKEWEGKALV